MSEAHTCIEGNACSRSGRRGLILAALLLLGGGLLVLSRGAADTWIRETVYYFSTAGVVGCLYYLQRCLRASSWRWLPPRRVFLTGGLTVAITVFLLWVHADWGFKVMPREYTDASSARNLHEYREFFVTHSGEAQAKAFIPTRTSVDSGMWLQPYLVSLVHDLVGYRAAAPVWLNAFCLPLFLSLFFFFAWRLADARAAVVGTLLWATLPLLSQASTGAGNSLLLMSLLTAVCLLAASYLRRPSREREGILASAAILLAYTDASGAWFLLPTALTILCGWWRTRRCFLSAGLITWPLMLLPVVGQLLRSCGRAESVCRVDGVYLAANGPHALNFFFSFDSSQPNSLLLSALGLFALIGLPFVLRRDLKTHLALGKMEWLSLLLFAPFVLLQLFSLLSTERMRLDLFENSFHALSLHWLFVSVITLTLFYLSLRVSGLYGKFVMLAVVYFIAYTAPSNSKAIYLYSNHTLMEQRWLQRLSTSSLREDSLVIDPQTVPWSLKEWTAQEPEHVSNYLGWISAEVSRGRYPAIYLVERSVYKGGGDFVPISATEAKILENFTTEVVAEKSFRPFTLTRVSRLVAYQPVEEE